MIMLGIQAVGSALMIAAGVGAARRSRRWATAAVGAMLGLILLKVAAGYTPAAEPRLFPWDWYPYVEPWWTVFPAMFLLGAGVVVVGNSPWKRDALLVGGGVLLLRTFAVAWATSGDPDVNGTVDDRGVCLQTSGYTCAPAAAASFLYYYGVPATEREMAVLCVTRVGGLTLAGTSDAGIMRGLRRKMPRGRVRIMRPEYEEFPTPALVPMEISPRVGHCILVWKVEPEVVHVIDPLWGRGSLTRAAFERQWAGSAIFWEDTPH